MTTLPLSPETAGRRPKPVSVADIAARRAERDELLRTATALMAGRIAHEGLDPESLDAEAAVDFAAKLIAAVNARFEEAFDLQPAFNSAAKDGAVNKVECGARCPEEPSDGPDWSRLKGEVIERIDALAALHDKLDAPPEWRAKLWNDLALPNLRLLAEFVQNITLNDEDEDEDSEVVS